MAEEDLEKPEPELSGVEEKQTSAAPEALTVIPTSDWKAQETLSGSLGSLREERRVAAGAIFGLASAGAKMLEDELSSARADRQAADAVRGRIGSRVCLRIRTDRSRL